MCRIADFQIRTFVFRCTCANWHALVRQRIIGVRNGDCVRHLNHWRVWELKFSPIVGQLRSCAGHPTVITIPNSAGENRSALLTFMSRPTPDFHLDTFFAYFLLLRQGPVNRFVLFSISLVSLSTHQCCCTAYFLAVTITHNTAWYRLFHLLARLTVL
jgi:hypothetical protein